MPDSRARVRAIFAVAILLLAAQVWFSEAFEEPYPALAMPAFRGAGGHAHGAVSGQAHALVFGLADGRERRVSWAELWPPQHKLGDGLAILCRSKMRWPSEAIPYRWLPGYRVGAVRRDRPESDAALRAWLRARARVLLAGEEPHWFECRVFRERIRVRDGRVERERRPRSTLRLDLGP